MNKSLPSHSYNSNYNYNATTSDVTRQSSTNHLTNTNNSLNRNENSNNTSYTPLTDIGSININVKNKILNVTSDEIPVHDRKQTQTEQLLLSQQINY